jgi:hypothetical protein
MWSLYTLVRAFYNSCMKRIEMKTTIAPETKKALEKIARREGLTDHGLPSKGRAIDFLVLNYQLIKAGATKTQSSSNIGI